MKPTLIRIVLEKGACFDAQAWGDFSQPRSGELVFCTAMTGLEESLTDPSFCGQVLVSTSSHVGNTGFTEEDRESSKIWAEALVCRHLTKKASNWRAKKNLLEWILSEKRFVVEGVNTRELTLYLREQGSQRALFFERDTLSDQEALLYIQKRVPSMEGACFFDQVSVQETQEFVNKEEAYWPQQSELALAGEQRKPKVLVWDFGVKRNTLRILSQMGCRVFLVPAVTKAEELLALNPDGVLLSNGPGDPAAAKEVVEEIKKVLGKVPLYGICMGHQLIATALGARTKKMTFGHRGVHHPVNEYDEQNRVVKTWITSQNHGFVVDEESLASKIRVTHRHANDMSVEGLAVPEKKCATVQFHPEAAPGPMDSLNFFNNFLKEIKNAY